MLRRAVFVLVLTVSVVLLVGSCSEQRASRVDIVGELDSLQHKLLWADERISEETWSAMTTGSADSLDFFVNLRRYVLYSASFSPAWTGSDNLLGSEENKRRFVILGNDVKEAGIELSSPVKHLRDTIENDFAHNVIDFEGTSPRHDALLRVFQNASNRDRRESAWRAMNAIGNGADKKIERLFRTRNQEARKHRYNNYFALMFTGHQIPTADYLQLLQKIDSITADPYRQILDFVRERLGRQDIEIWDIYAPYASVEEAVSNFFTVDSQMDFIDAGLADMGFDLDKLPVYLAVNDDPEGVPFARTLIVHPPEDQRVVGNLNGGVRSAQMLMSALASALTAAYTTEQERLFASMQVEPWRAGMQNLFASFCTDTLWLQKYMGVPRNVAENFGKAQHDRFIIGLRLLLTDAMFEYEAYSNPDRDLNNLYWNLFERYTFLPPHQDVKPWAADLSYVSQPLSLQWEMIGRLISRQTVAYLERTNGKLIGTQDTRSFLAQNYFRFGSRYPWTELLERGTGEPLNPDYLVRNRQIE